MLVDFLKTLPQYLIPHHFLSRLVFKLTRYQGDILVHWLIKRFIRYYHIDMNLAVFPEVCHYSSFNQFFTRALKPSTRPIAETGIISPVDGQISQLGQLQEGLLLQAKSHWFQLEELVGKHPRMTLLFKQGLFCTLYLSPRDYHRIHMPITGRLTDMIYIPGRLFSVNQTTTHVVPNLFARNERLICLFETPAGTMALILIGALFVGNLETVWTGPLLPSPHPRYWSYAPENAPILVRGAEMGRFNMGSTVIILLEAQRATWLPELLVQDKLLMGNGLAYILPNS